MKKIIVSILLFVFLVIFSTIGYHVVSANEMVDEVDNILVMQEEIEHHFSSYGYTVDNPFILLNPYGISPLTALIMFDTEDEVSVSVSVIGKSDDTTFSNTFVKSKKHIIPIYGLYADYNNKIVLSIENTKKEYYIQTEKLPSDFVSEKVEVGEQVTFINHSKYPYAVDKNQDVRWFLSKNYFGKIKRLSNGNFLLGSDIFLDDGVSKDILEIDLLGKVFYQYDVVSGYYGSFCEVGSSIFVLSDDVIEFDKQSGVVLQTIHLDKKYIGIDFNSTSNMLELLGEHGEIAVIDMQNHHIYKDENTVMRDEKIYSSSFYFNQDEYHFFKGVKFSNHQVTPVSKEKIFLIGYKKIDGNYSKYNIKFKKVGDYFSISGDFDDEAVFVILDKFLDKRIYSFSDKKLFISNNGLSGKYSIYIKINDVIYKTNQYVSF